MKTPTIVKRMLAYGGFSLIGGIFLRYFAYGIAWPKEWGYSGARENTVWAIKERALIDISYAFMLLGILLLLLVAKKYLFYIPENQ